MPPAAPAPRYLLAFDTADVPVETADVLVVGSGAAALRAAIAVAEAGASVLAVTKREPEDGSTRLAQGGLAAAIAPGDSVESHVQDTVRAGWGLSEPAFVRGVIADGARAAEELLAWGARFDRRGGALDFTQEGGHAVPRILHAGGDATGAEISRVLLARARKAGVRIRAHTAAVDLLTRGRRCVGLLAADERDRPVALFAHRVILATGGAGQLYRETTNPDVVTCDGMAMAWRAGAALADLEFVQFHPTTLYVAGATRALVSEAVRGEGGILRDRTGKPFMRDLHPLGDLAPRDIVSRCIVRQMEATGDTNVYLDVTHIPARTFRQRFPGIAQTCDRFGLNYSRDPIPVRPSAHYMIGGVRTDAAGRTSLPGLSACGEVAATTFHGANRLGSNSLLECLVFGKRAGEDAVRGLKGRRAPRPERIVAVRRRPRAVEIDAGDVRNALKALMWRQVGVERHADRLAGAIHQIAFWQGYILDKAFDDPSGWELQNLLVLGGLVAESALKRRESRGVHTRIDYPETDERRWRRHLVVRKGR
jgi:L-aspartate oxidase